MEEDELDGDDAVEPASKRKKRLVIEVLEFNWNAVEVFRRCEPEWVSGMRVARMGIPAAEIRSAASMMRIPRAEWMQLIDDVQLMGRVAAEALNRVTRTQ